MFDVGPRSVCQPSGRQNTVHPPTLQTASQGASDKDVKKKNSGRGATTSGERCFSGFHVQAVMQDLSLH